MKKFVLDTFVAEKASEFHSNHLDSYPPNWEAAKK